MKLFLTLFACFAITTSALSQATTSPEPAGKRSDVTIKMLDKAGIESWAACGWQKLPVSSQNLLNYFNKTRAEPTGEVIPFASRQENLAARLDVVCGDLLSPQDRKSISFGVKRAKMIALNESRPLQPGIKDGKVAAYVCSHLVSGQYMLTENGLSKPKPKLQVGADETRCFKLNDDGSLTNA